MSISLIGENGTSIVTDANPIPVQLSSAGNNVVTLSPEDVLIDAFNRIRVSEPRVAFEYSFGAFPPTSATTIWEATAVSSGTQALTTNLYGTELNTLVGTGTGYWIQSYNHVRYAPGISTLLRFTFNFNTPLTNCRKRVGMFTDQGTYPSILGDGLYLEQDGAAVAVVRRSLAVGAGGSEERVLQPAWNLDKLDGTGASGVLLDWEIAQHLVIEFQWLGVGTIRFGFETAAGVVWCHKMVSVNSISTAWSRTGCLPVRAEIQANGALASPGKLTLINVCVIQEGDVSDVRGWRYFGATSGATAKVGGTATGLYPVMGLKAATTNDLTKRARIIPHTITISVLVISTGATSLQASLLMNGTPATGATFAVATGGSATVVDIAATATTAITGTTLWGVVVPNVVGTYTYDLSTLNDNMNVIGYNAAGAVAITGSANLYLAVGTLTGTATVAATVAAAINWKEIV